MRKFILSASVLFALCGQLPDVISAASEGKFEKEFVNGGVAVALKDRNSVSANADAIAPGTAFAFWKDIVLRLDQGPAIANRVVTVISGELITEVTFRSTEAQAVQKGLGQEISGQGLASRSSSRGLQSSSTLLKLIELAKIYAYRSGMTIRDLLEFYREKKLLNDDELRQLDEIIRSSGLAADRSLQDLIQWLQSNQVDFSVSSATYEILQKQYKLDSIEVGKSTESALKTSNLDSIEVGKSMGTALKTSNLDSASSYNQLNVSVTSGQAIVLKKACDQKFVWFKSKMTYTIEFENVGTMATTDLLIVDFLPSGLEFEEIVSKSHSLRFSQLDTRQTQALFFAVRGNIEPKEKGSIVFSVYVKE